MLIRELFEAKAPKMGDKFVDQNATQRSVEAGHEEHWEALEKTGFFGAAGAGCIIMARSTGRILLAFRSRMVEQPHTWGNWGGAIDPGMNPKEAALQEVTQECGYVGPVEMIPLYVFKKGTFRYYNFLAIVEDEFNPALGWETERAKWCEWGKWPKPLHFGLEALFNDPTSVKIITNEIKKAKQK